MSRAAGRAEYAAVGGREVLDLHVAGLRQRFNAMDPAPFREREPHANAEVHIVESARETRSGQPPALRVRLARKRGSERRGGSA